MTEAGRGKKHSHDRFATEQEQPIVSGGVSSKLLRQPVAVDCSSRRLKKNGADGIARQQRFIPKSTAQPRGIADDQLLVTNEQRVRADHAAIGQYDLRPCFRIAAASPISQVRGCHNADFARRLEAKIPFAINAGELRGEWRLSDGKGHRGDINRDRGAIETAKGKNKRGSDSFPQ